MYQDCWNSTPTYIARILGAVHQVASRLVEDILRTDSLRRRVEVHTGNQDSPAEADRSLGVGIPLAASAVVDRTEGSDALDLGSLGSLPMTAGIDRVRARGEDNGRRAHADRVGHVREHQEAGVLVIE